MRIAIVDDDVKWQVSADTLIRSFPWTEDISVDIFSNGKEVCEADIYDVIFMDVEMPIMDGFEAAKRCKEKNKETIIVFLTTHIEQCNRGYMVNAFRYIYKEKMEEELQEAMESITALRKRNHTLTFHVLGVGDYQLPIEKILYFETEKRNVMIHTTDQKVITNRKIEELEEDLREYGFFRCHKSFLVNLRNVEGCDKKTVYIKNGESVFLSERRYSDFKQKHMEYVFSYANS